MSSKRRGSPSRSVLLSTTLGITLPFLVTQAQDNASDEDAQKKEARVTVVVHDVKLLAEDKDPRPVQLEERVTEDNSVRTGDASRSELTFLDLTIERMGSNTIFSFNKAGRSVQLNSGSILLRVPKNSGGANLKTSACSVAITGTVLILEVKKDGRNTLAVLNGGAKMSLNKYPQESMFARGGQLLNVPPGAKKMPKPMNIDVKRIVKAHPLLADFPPLPNEDDLYSDNNTPAGGSSSTSSPPPVVSNPTGPAPAGPITTGPIVNPGGNFPPTGGFVPVDTGTVDMPTHNKRRHGDKPNHNKSNDGETYPNPNSDDGKTKNPKKPGRRHHGSGDGTSTNTGGKKGKGTTNDGNGPVVNNGANAAGGNAAAGNSKVYSGKLPGGYKAVGQPANVAKPTPTPHRRIIRKNKGGNVP